RPILATQDQVLEVALPAEALRVRCDRHRIFQVFSNLIGNASKFSPKGSAIRVAAMPRDGEALFEIADRGCGISTDHLARIFEPYWQASQQRQQGLGLG